MVPPNANLTGAHQYRIKKQMAAHQALAEQKARMMGFARGRNVMPADLARMREYMHSKAKEMELARNTTTTRNESGGSSQTRTYNLSGTSTSRSRPSPGSAASRTARNWFRRSA